MQNMKSLAEVIGSDEVDTHIVPAIIQIANDKIWRVKLAIIEFIPLLAEFLDINVF
jgi:serine/threonine-protein phosphatase 2A regulatory subunit A